MTRIAALILSDARGDTVFAGLSLIERAVLSATRAGATRIHIVGAPANLSTRSLPQGPTVVTSSPSEQKPFADAPRADVLLVLDVNTIVERGALSTLSRRDDAKPGEAALLVDSDPHALDRFVEVLDGRVTSAFTDGNASSLNVVAMTVQAVEAVRHVGTLHEALDRLSGLGRLRAVSPGARFARKLQSLEDLATVEVQYLRHTNGGAAEGFFTRQVRRLSIPLSRLLLRTSVSANQVTLAGFGLSIAAGVFFWMATYWAGLMGAGAYYVSTVFDCSDGEVARARLSDSRFGAWLETVTDYLSYFVVLGGITWGEVRHAGFCSHAVAAVIGATATLTIMLLVAYLRARVATANPGALDDALAAELKQGTRTQKFAGWARQLIKRSFLAHLIVFQAVIGHLPALLEVWAYGSVGALLVVIAVQSHLARSVRVEPLQPVPTL